MNFRIAPSAQPSNPLRFGMAKRIFTVNDDDETFVSRKPGDTEGTSQSSSPMPKHLMRNALVVIGDNGKQIALHPNFIIASDNDLPALEKFHNDLYKVDPETALENFIATPEQSPLRSEWDI